MGRILVPGWKPTRRATQTQRSAAPVAVIVILAMLLAPSVAAARRPTKPKRCPTALTRVSVPPFSTVPPGPGTTTTTVPCRAVSLDKHAAYLGVLSWGLSQPVPAGTQYSDAILDLALRDDGEGKLTGKLAGTQSQTLTLSTCPSTTVAPGIVKATLTGERDASTMSLVAEDVTYSPPQVTPCPGGTPGIIGGLSTFPQTTVALDRLKGDRARYRYHHKETVQAGPYPFTIEYSILVVKVKK